MKESDQATSIPNCLFVPDHLFVSTMTFILRHVSILLATELLVCSAHWENEKESMGWPRHESEQLGLVDAEDVMECELVRETELVHERGHDLWVVLCRDV